MPVFEGGSDVVVPLEPEPLLPELPELPLLLLLDLCAAITFGVTMVSTVATNMTLSIISLFISGT
jgi:hypothetical protein